MRLIDADALIDKLDIMISEAILDDTEIHYALIRELVAEQPTEVVHHINGVKTDNRPENLVVLSNGEHVSLHNSKGTETKCLRCGKIKKLHARGLCGTCYHYVFMRGELNKWYLSTNQSKRDAME